MWDKFPSSELSSKAVEGRQAEAVPVSRSADPEAQRLAHARRTPERGPVPDVLCDPALTHRPDPRPVGVSQSRPERAAAADRDLPHDGATGCGGDTGADPAGGPVGVGSPAARGSPELTNNQAMAAIVGQVTLYKYL